MKQTRRQFIATSTAAITVLPFHAQAESHSRHSFSTPGGELRVRPISHASIVMETPRGVMMIDPVGDAERYGSYAPAPYILITHEHGDHLRVDTLLGLVDDNTQIIANQPVYDQMPEELQKLTTVLRNGDKGMLGESEVEAIGAYNLTEDRLNFHPKGRDNGYVINLEGFRVYVSGDTEDIPEMRALENIDLAFVCMNLPFTMDASAAADAVKAFAPTFVYPYHYRGRDGGTQDPTAFKKFVGDVSDVKLAGWYNA